MTDRRGTGFMANTLANLAVGVAGLGYAVIVPGVVVRRFGAELYGNWYLAFQVAAYILLLDLGSQFVVTNEAAAPSPGMRSARLATAAMLAQSALAGAVLVAATGWALLTGQGQLAQLIVVLGIAATASLLASTIRAWFAGLRRAHVPAIWLVAARAGSLAGLAVAVIAGTGLLALTVAVCAPQLIVHAGLLLWAHRPPSPWALPDRSAFARLGRTSIPLALWTVCGVVVGGIDIFIVRAVDPAEVGRYAIALPLLAVPTGVVTAAVTAWMPRVSRAEGAGARAGRDSTLAGTTVMAAALALGGVLFLGFPDGLVRLLAGRGAWAASETYVQLLYLATCIRFVLLPYVILGVVRGEQGRIILAPIAEAATNLIVSLVLGLWIGAVGVALGTLVGALVSVAAHLSRSVRRTAGSGLTSSALLAAAGRPWPLVVTAGFLALLVRAEVGGVWRAVAALVAVAVDAWWLVSHGRDLWASPVALAPSWEP